MPLVGAFWILGAAVTVLIGPVPAALAVAWSAAAAIASAAWTAVALALDTILTFAATGAMAPPSGKGRYGHAG